MKLPKRYQLEQAIENLSSEKARNRFQNLAKEIRILSNNENFLIWKTLHLKQIFWNFFVMTFDDLIPFFHNHQFSRHGS